MPRKALITILTAQKVLKIFSSLLHTFYSIAALFRLHFCPLLHFDFILLDISFRLIICSFFPFPPQNVYRQFLLYAKGGRICKTHCSLSLHMVK